MLLMGTGSFAQKKPLCDFGLSESRGDQYETEWYSEQLAALGEQCLSPAQFAPKRPTYRFLWLRSFRHPVSARLEIKEDGSGTIFLRETDGHSVIAPKGNKWGKLVRQTEVSVAKPEVDEFLKQLSKSGFWSSAFTRQLGNDGAQWIMESYDGSRYRMQQKWTPPDGDTFRAVCLKLMDLSKFDVKSEEIY